MASHAGVGINNNLSQAKNRPENISSLSKRQVKLAKADHQLHQGRNHTCSLELIIPDFSTIPGTHTLMAIESARDPYKVKTRLSWQSCQ